jgi:hypothetical protein
MAKRRYPSGIRAHFGCATFSTVATSLRGVEAFDRVD